MRYLRMLVATAIGGMMMQGCFAAQPAQEQATSDNLVVRNGIGKPIKIGQFGGNTTSFESVDSGALMVVRPDTTRLVLGDSGTVETIQPSAGNLVITNNLNIHIMVGQSWQTGVRGIPQGTSLQIPRGSGTLNFEENVIEHGGPARPPRDSSWERIKEEKQALEAAKRKDDEIIALKDAITQKTKQLEELKAQYQKMTPFWVGPAEMIARAKTADAIAQAQRDLILLQKKLIGKLPPEDEMYKRISHSLAQMAEAENALIAKLEADTSLGELARDIKAALDSNPLDADKLGAAVKAALEKAVQVDTRNMSPGELNIHGGHFQMLAREACKKFNIKLSPEVSRIIGVWSNKRDEYMGIPYEPYPANWKKMTPAEQAEWMKHRAC